ncbi:iron complex transport system substrate-binding protein [Pseudonocardia thermophila]|uniref:Iron complex transport system substrate-binding protein n=1 Tax=Pseudonocardia thermophila TaxID=1848 RepID=A0A1M6QK64_PSETH|nr:iron-siderophore ABC transporter substrate-binding protein [Pseudonocardia thermophila]SHK20664.1 iron complex transport system substrate-binding protein [Pseudonocardia thermophila]
MRARTPLVLVAILLALAGLTACGTSEPAAGAGPTAAAAASGGPITVTDLRGKQITLDKPAARVVGLEWNVIEHAVSLGVMPVGAADIKGYSAWVQSEPLDASVKDVGVRGEPSVESIAALQPDLILATDQLPEGAVAQMEQFAPVVFVPGGDAEDPVGQMRENLQLVAKLVGKEAEAQKLLADFDAKLADAKTKLAAKTGQKFVFTDGWAEGGQVSLRPYTKGSLVGGVTEQLGLVDAWPAEEGDAVYGLAQSDVEGLTRVGDVEFLYIVNDADGGDVFANELRDNAVWKSLPFVQAGKVHRIPDGMWMFGGPTSLAIYVDAVVAALA